MRVDTTQFNVIDRGAGVPVVFLHAGVCDARMWSTQIDAVVDAGHRAIAYDRRGFGATVFDVNEPCSHVSDLADILDHLDVGAAILVGSSIGAGLAIDFALTFPHRVIGLVLSGSAVSGAPWTGVFPDHYRAEMIAYETGKDTSEDDQLNAIEAQAWLDGPGEAEGRVSGALRDLFLQMNGQAIAHERPQLIDEDLDEWARLEDIEYPTLLVSGALDWSYLVEWHDEMEARMPNAFAVIVEDAAHLPNLERPQVFNPLLVGFLTQLFGDH